MIKSIRWLFIYLKNPCYDKCMNLAIIKENYHWTDHVRNKMRQYRLTESRVKRVLRHPKRVETGVAEDTVAGMQPAGSPKHPFEIWVMWTTGRKARGASRQSPKDSSQPDPLLSGGGKSKNKFNFGGEKIIIISAWRYPGVSPLREPPPIPDDAWAELRRLNK